MRLSSDRRLAFAPPDLIVYLESSFASWKDRAYLERQLFERGHLAVHRVRMQIRDVEQERTARRGGHLVEELALGHLMGAPHERTRWVLEKQRHVGK